MIEKLLDSHSIWLIITVFIAIWLAGSALEQKVGQQKLGNWLTSGSKKIAIN